MFNFICKRNFLIVIIIMVFQNLIILTLKINTFSSLLIIKIFINDIFNKYRRYDVLTERKKVLLWPFANNIFCWLLQNLLIKTF